MIKLWSISANTFLQTIRQPVYTVMILVTFGLLIFTLPFAGYTLSIDFESTDQQMLEDLGLGTLRISGLLIAALSASGVLRREIEEKTALIVIAKPVSRWLFVLGKFLGVLAAVAVAYWLCSIVFLMTVRHQVMPTVRHHIDWPVVTIGVSAFLAAVLVAMLGNLWFGWQFTSASVWAEAILMTVALLAVGFVGKGWRVTPFGEGVSTVLLGHLGMMFLAVVLFVALAVTASVRLGQSMTLLVCAAVFFVGSAHPQIFDRWLRDVPLVRVLGWLTPNFSHFYPREDLDATGIPPNQAALSVLYCLLYTAGMLSVGMALFQTRELESQASSGATPTLVSFLAWTGRAGALLAALAGAVVVTTPRLWSAAGALIGAGLLVAAAAGWLVWGAFGYGRRWSYWLILGLCALSAAAGPAGLLLPRAGALRAVGGSVAMAALTTIAATTLIVLVLPKTRRHFRFSPRRVG